MAEAGGLYYEVHGRAGAPPLILSSGLGGSASYWAANVAAFAERFQVVTYDHRGCGRSDRTPLPGLSVADMAADVVGLLDHLEIERAHMVGHALGGLIGMTLALDAPARLDKLVVVNGWGRLEPHTARCFDARLALLRHAGAEAYLRAQPIFLYPANWLTLDAPHLAADEAMMLEDLPAPAFLEQRIAAVRAFDVQNRLGEIAAPLLAVASSDDILVPSVASERLAERLAPESGGGIYRMRWGGHACNVTDPATFNTVVPGWIADGIVPEE